MFARHFVARPRSMERLDQGAQGPLTLVAAAAGYGKTTLVSSWIESFAADDEVNVQPRRLDHPRRTR